MKKFFWITVLAWDLAVALTLARWDPHLQVHMLNIGQGDAILVTTAEQSHILVDGGPDEKVLTQLGEVLPFFFRDIDLMVLTHPHADHVVGLISVLQRFRVHAVLMSAPVYDSEPYHAFLRAVQAAGVPVYMAQADMDFRLGAATVDVLYPFQPTTGDAFENQNDASVVMKISESGHSVLLTGDALVKEEEALVALSERGEIDLTADVLKAGHHGSHSSSSEAFLEAVGAELLLISCEQGNSYGHPHKETLQKAAALGMEVLRTDVAGRVDLVFDDGGADIGGNDARSVVQSWLRWILAPSWRSFSSSPS